MGSAQVIQLFRAAAFDPETVKRLCSAYDIATNSLHDRDRHPAIVNEIIAQKIIALAERGERDPKSLAENALIEVGISTIR